ncbi:hypothetical protein C2E25_16715 [Geothermobacter hydrogeniphilus]|uniref:Uncharacterized protein n=1 Tax=Geothermobacter hydrogeniphilus TaxID=1969733 RepID=A0A2K2H5Y8_9BACT|nr:hypothetical protein C2E25_16715 [Geothermobacter hydrogeniphilus]
MFCPGDPIIDRSAEDLDIEHVADDSLFDFGLEGAFDSQIDGPLEDFLTGDLHPYGSVCAMV